MSAATLSPAAELEREPADIPHEERADLLEEVEASLVDAGDDPVAHRGTPARFAAELRASAGLPPRPVRPVALREPLWTRLKRHPHTRAAAAPAREIARIWWLPRDVIVAGLLTVGAGRHSREIVSVLTRQPAIGAFLLALIPNAVPGRLDPRPLR